MPFPPHYSAQLKNRSHTHPFITTIIVTIAHSVLALIATYPLLGMIQTVVIGNGDTVQNAWNLWWVQRSVATGVGFPFYTQSIYWPTGVSLAYHPLGLLNGWAATLVQFLFGLHIELIYNLLTLTTFILTGLFTFYLANYLVKHAPAAFVASVIFTFAPIRISRVFFGNLEMYSTECIPLAVLFAIKMVRERKWYYAIFSALALAATIWLSLYLALGTALLLFIIISAEFIANKAQRIALLRLLSMMALTTAILALPIIWPMVADYAMFQNQSSQLTASMYNNADLLGFFIPDNTLNLTIKKVLPATSAPIAQLYARFYGNPSEKTVFIGYTVMLIIVATVVLSPKKKLFWTWAVVSGLFFVLSLGPLLYINGKATGVYLPYQWLNSIPFVSFGRVPSRLALFLMLGLAILCSIGLADIGRSYKKFTIVILCISMVVFGEFLAIPMRVDERFKAIPAFYYQFAATGARGAILDVPIDIIGAQGPAGNYMLYQMVHKQPIVSGYISRTPQQVLKLFTYPFINELRVRIYQDLTTPQFNAAMLAHAMAELNTLDVRFVILHKAELQANELHSMRMALDAVLRTPMYEDTQLVVWALR